MIWFGGISKCASLDWPACEIFLNRYDGILPCKEVLSKHWGCRRARIVNYSAQVAFQAENYRNGHLTYSAL